MPAGATWAKACRQAGPPPARSGSCCSRQRGTQPVVAVVRSIVYMVSLRPLPKGCESVTMMMMKANGGSTRPAVIGKFAHSLYFDGLERVGKRSRGCCFEVFPRVVETNHHVVCWLISPVRPRAPCSRLCSPLGGMGPGPRRWVRVGHWMMSQSSTRY